MTERLDGLLAHRGWGTRAGAKRLIRRGRVTVDGVVTCDAGAKIDASAEVRVDHTLTVAPPLLVAFHKPVGVVSTTADPWGRASLATALPREWSAHLHPVGRLDADTSGLLLFSADGQLTQRLLHPRRAVPRRYRAEVAGPVDAQALAARLTAGVRTAAGLAYAQLESVGEGTLELTVTEGKHRMVRRMLANAGHPVLALHRTRYGVVALGDLPAGELRPATEAELSWARALLSPPPPGPGRRDPP